MKNFLFTSIIQKWYIFGLAIGVPKEFLNKYLKDHSKEDCITEVLTAPSSRSTNVVRSG
jgi:hypothetical protein